MCGMATRDQVRKLRWTGVVPVLAAVVLALPGVLLAASVLAAVHHAEVVARRVGEPFGSLVSAVSVTIIEVALIVTLDGFRRLGAGQTYHGVRYRVRLAVMRERVAELRDRSSR